MNKVAALVLGVVVFSAYPARSAEVGQVFQSHTADGSPYWVVLCIQADECFEFAYKWCEGAYQPLDKSFTPMGGFRFLCRKSHKAASQAPTG